MSKDPAILLRGVGKMYKLYSSRLDNFLDAIGFRRVLPWRRVKYREFWALRGIDLEVPSGKRLGIIGCNGAGKTTLLKLITGNLPPTEGSRTVNGAVHALMTTGAGFHPEFTGLENIEASLTYQGLSPRQIRAAIDEIAEFTELDAFLDQPFKTYSAGMQARLTFATATTLAPDILIIDEILGAGDGYFLAKSTERITRLVQEAGATVLLVSHALDQTVRFCEETIWLDRGRIVQRGPTLEVVKAYEQFLRVRNERRLKAKNRLRGGGGRDTSQLGLYNNNLVFRFIVERAAAEACDITEVILRENGEAYEHLGIGDAQDSNISRPAFIQMGEKHGWSSPRSDRGRHYRSVILNDPDAAMARGSVVFYLYGLFDDSTYTAEITYRCRDAEVAAVEVLKDGEIIARHALPAGSGEWTTRVIEVAAPIGAIARKDEDSAAARTATETKRAARRWPSKGTLLIRDVKVCGPNGQEQAVFTPGQTMTIRLTVEATKTGTIPVLPAVTIFRLDGILVSHLLMNEVSTLSLTTGETRTLTLTINELNLGSGQYVFSVAVFGHQVSEQERYDLIDRAYEFEVTATEHRFRGTVFAHPGAWQVE